MSIAGTPIITPIIHPPNGNTPPSCRQAHTSVCCVPLSTSPFPSLLSLCLIFPCLALQLIIYQINLLAHFLPLLKKNPFINSFLGSFFFLQPLAPWTKLGISRNRGLKRSRSEEKGGPAGSRFKSTASHSRMKTMSCPVSLPLTHRAQTPSSLLPEQS